MTARRILGSLLATALAATSIAFVGAASPAAAASPTLIVPSTGESWISLNSKVPTYGDSAYFYIDVATADGTPEPTAGSVTLEQSVAGGPWTAIGTSAYPGYSGSVELTANTAFRVTYAGDPEGRWLPTTAELGVAVQRDITTDSISGKRAGVKGKLTPAAKTKITAFKKQGKKWKKFKTVRSTAKGRYTLILPAPRRGKFNWKIVFAGDQAFVSSVLFGSTKRGYY